jgi:LysR family transcriptional activator of nhaA
MTTWLNYHHLYYFKVIATEGSISRAADKLRLGQPTLSAQLKLFEDTIGVKLFDRQHKKLILNDTGRVALAYANEIFRTGSEMIEVLNDRLVPTRTHVQIGALDSVPKALILKVVRRLLSLGPCTVSILEGRADELIREVTLHKIDLFVSDHPPIRSEGERLFSKKILRSPVVVCGGDKYKSLKKQFPKSLDGVPMIVPTRHSKLRSDLEHYFEAANMRLDVAMETQDTSLQKLFGFEEMGLLPLPKVGIESSRDSVGLIELGVLPGVSVEYFLVAASRRIENPISSRLMKDGDWTP